MLLNYLKKAWNFYVIGLAAYSSVAKSVDFKVGEKYDLVNFGPELNGYVDMCFISTNYPLPEKAYEFVLPVDPQTGLNKNRFVALGGLLDVLQCIEEDQKEITFDQVEQCLSKPTNLFWKSPQGTSHQLVKNIDYDKSLCQHYSSLKG